MTQHDGRAVLGGQLEHGVVVRRPGEVEDSRSGLEHGPHRRDGVALDRDEDPVVGQGLDHGHELVDLVLGSDPVRCPVGGLRADVDDVGSLRGLHLALANRGGDRGSDALAVRRVARQVHHAHDRRPRIDV